MADGTEGGGRIVPIVSRSQSSGKAPEAVSKRTRKGKRNRLFSEPECLHIPCLDDLGLYALPTEGDGNCLYYALSDQVYGDFTHGEEIRTRLADHMSENKEYFMSFIAASGGERRAPRRAASLAVRYSSCPSLPSTANRPSAKDHEQSFDTKVAYSRKSGVWGGAEEIQAFCQSFKFDVNVYTMYGVQRFRDVNAPEDEERATAHIAFHDFNHYSSVRHKDGPHTGPPCIPKKLNVKKQERHAERANSDTAVDMATPWKISVIQEGLGGKYTRETIVDMLQQCRGNIDRAFSNLIDEDGAQTDTMAPKMPLKQLLHDSRSSSPFSTGSKRSAESDPEEEDPRPANRRARGRGREQKKRILPDVTVGIAFRDDQNDLVSLRLRVSPDMEAKDAAAGSHPETDQDSGRETEQRASREHQTEPTRGKSLRRSCRTTKTLNLNEGS